MSLNTGSRLEVHSAMQAPTLVKEYPGDKPYPSRLVLGWVGGRPLHIVLAGPTDAGDTIVVTLYEPAVEMWESGFARRRREP